MILCHVLCSKLVLNSSLSIIILHIIKKHKSFNRNYFLKNEDDLNISEVPSPGQKLLSQYDSPICIVQFWYVTQIFLLIL